MAKAPKVFVLNGPILNMFGSRHPDVPRRTAFCDIMEGGKEPVAAPSRKTVAASQPGTALPLISFNFINRHRRHCLGLQSMRLKALAAVLRAVESVGLSMVARAMPRRLKAQQET